MRLFASRGPGAAVLSGLMLLGLASCAALGIGSSSSSVDTPYHVFFSERSPALEPAGAGVIASAADAAKASPNQPVLVLGWTDSAGSPQADVALSQERARRVADALVADGVSPSRITRQGRGQTGNDPGVESRRVDIRIGS